MVALTEQGRAQSVNSLVSKCFMSFNCQKHSANPLHSSTLPLAKQHDMDPLSVSVFAIGVAQVLVSSYKHLLRDAHDFGVFPPIALRLGLFEAKEVVEQVREHFIKGDGGLDQAMAFKDSYTPTLIWSVWQALSLLRLHSQR